MAAGIVVTKQEVDAAAGSIARDLHGIVARATELKAWLDGKTDADLIALGYVQADVDAIRSAFADAAQLGAIYNGSAALAVAKNFGTFLKRLAGLSRV